MTQAPPNIHTPIFHAIFFYETHWWCFSLDIKRWPGNTLALQTNNPAVLTVIGSYETIFESTCKVHDEPFWVYTRSLTVNQRQFRGWMGVWREQIYVYVFVFAFVFSSIWLKELWRSSIKCRQTKNISTQTVHFVAGGNILKTTYISDSTPNTVELDYFKAMYWTIYLYRSGWAFSMTFVYGGITWTVKLL